MPPKHIVIIAGEASGDLHASSLVRELNDLATSSKVHDNNDIITVPIPGQQPFISERASFVFSGIGGTQMQQAGVNIISDLAKFGVTGLFEVIAHFKVIRQAFSAIKEHLRKTKPELLILVDYPGFNLRLARFVKQELAIPILYYISPQIWAWKANRIAIIKRYVDKMAVILPFEKKIYQQAGIEATFVGHPLVNTPHLAAAGKNWRKILNLPEKSLIVAMLPGSRINEVERHMPIFVKTAELLSKEIKSLHFLLPIAKSLNPELIKNYFAKTKLSVSFTLGQTIEAVSCSDCVVVASGTASLECALLEKPMCIVYKSSLLTYIAACKLIQVKYLGLCNLLQQKMIVPELLQYDLNPQELSVLIKKLLFDVDLISSMKKQLKELKDSLSLAKADCSLPQLVLKSLQI